MTGVLIIGGTGFLGINLALSLKQRGDHVTLVGTRPVRPEMRSAIPDLAVHTVRLSDCAAIDDLLASIKPSLVIHMASTLTPASSYEQYMVERSQIITPTYQLIELMARKKLPLVFFSSGGAIYGLSDKQRMNEANLCNPISFYGQSKLEIESYIRFAHRALGLSYIIFRPANPYGPWQLSNSGQGLISTILGKLHRNEALEIWGDGRTVRDYIHVEDLVSATCAVLASGVWNTTINIGSGCGHSLLDVVRATENATGQKLATIVRPARGVDVDRVVLDVSRLANLNAFHSRPLEVGIQDYVKQLGLNKND